MSDGGWRTRGHRLISATAFFLFIAPAVASAADGPEPTTEPEPATETDTKRAEDTALRVDVGGRVFARARSDERTEWEREMSLRSARFELDARFGIARAVMEAELAGGNIIKDAYVRLEPMEGLRFYAGQFRAPFMARALESRWDLPLMSRGLVEGYLTESHQLAGRRLGVMGELKVDAWREFEVQLGAFQGAEDELGHRLGEDVSARVAFEPWNKRLDVGANVYWAAPGTRARFAAGADAAFDVGGLRIDAEMLAGRLAMGRFTAQLLLVSWRVPFGEENTWAVEPLVAGEALQLVGPSSGTAASAAVGVNVHYGDRIRVQTQVERALRPGDSVAGTELAVQLGARF